MAFYGSDSEPVPSTIYTRQWSDAVHRLAHLPTADQRAYGNLMGLVNAGWHHVRPLQRFVARAKLTEPSPRMHTLLEFCDAEVVEMFRSIALSLAEYVPGAPEWDDDADPTNLDADVGLFTRYLNVLHMASAQAEVHGEFRLLIDRCQRAFDGWTGEFTAEIAIIQKRRSRSHRASSPSPGSETADA